MKRFLGAPIISYLPAAVLLALALAYLVTAYSYTPQAREFPAGVAWATIVLAIVDLVSRTQTGIGMTLTRWFNPAALPGREDPSKQYPIAKQFVAVLWVVGFVALIFTVGFYYAVPVFVFASVSLRGGRPYWMGLAVSLAATFFLWMLFAQILEIELYRGVFFQEF